MSSCEAWPTSFSSLGPFSSRASPSRRSTIGGACALIASTPPQISIMIVMWFSMDFLAEQFLLIRRIDLGQGGCGLIDRLGGFQNLLRRFFRSADNRAKLTVYSGHFLAIETVAVQNRDFPLGAAYGIVNEVEFDLELFALLDLRAIGFDQRTGFGGLAHDRRAGCLRSGTVADAGHLGADGAQFAHDLAVHGTDVAVIGRWHRHVAGKCFFNTKTSAMNRHEIPPDH